MPLCAIVELYDLINEWLTDKDKSKFRLIKAFYDEVYDIGQQYGVAPYKLPDFTITKVKFTYQITNNLKANMLINIKLNYEKPKPMLVKDYHTNPKAEIFQDKAMYDEPALYKADEKMSAYGFFTSTKNKKKYWQTPNPMAKENKTRSRAARSTAVKKNRSRLEKVECGNPDNLWDWETDPHYYDYSYDYGNDNYYNDDYYDYDYYDYDYDY